MLSQETVQRSFPMLLQAAFLMNLSQGSRVCSYYLWQGLTYRRCWEDSLCQASKTPLLLHFCGTNSELSFALLWCWGHTSHMKLNKACHYILTLIAQNVIELNGATALCFSRTWLWRNNNSLVYKGRNKLFLLYRKCRCNTVIIDTGMIHLEILVISCQKKLLSSPKWL